MNIFHKMHELLRMHYDLQLEKTTPIKAVDIYGDMHDLIDVVEVLSASTYRGTALLTMSIDDMIVAYRKLQLGLDRGMYPAHNYVSLMQILSAIRSLISILHPEYVQKLDDIDRECYDKTQSKGAKLNDTVHF